MTKQTKKANAINKASRLTELAEREFDCVNKAEKKLFKAVIKGELADYSGEVEEENDPAEVESWDEERVLNAKIIVWLCHNPQASELVSHKGIGIKGASFEGELELQSTKVSFPFYFEKCAFPQGINLVNAKISTIDFRGIYSRSVRADNIEVRGGFYLKEGFKINGCLSLMCATIRGGLICTKGEIINPGEDALLLDNSNTGGDVFLNDDFKANGRTRLIGASIRGDLDCFKGAFINPGKKAFDAGGLKVEGNIFLSNGYKAQGEVRLQGSSIGGSLDCNEGEFVNPGGIAIVANNLNVSGDIFLKDNFKANGEVNIVGTSIGGSLICSKGEFINPNEEALSANNLKVGGNVLFDKSFKVKGKINLTGATIGRVFKWGNIVSLKDVKLDLQSTRIDTLWDDHKSWPLCNALFLTGLTYNNIHEKAPREVKKRIDWLHRQPEKSFTLQPYEQLAVYYRKIGHVENAKKILIKKSKDRAKFGKLKKGERAWNYVLGKLIGYGYRPWRAFFYSWLFIAFGLGVFYIGFSKNIIIPTKEWAYISESAEPSKFLSEDYPKFEPFVYSLDMFVPLVDLKQASYWIPNANRKGELHISKKCKLPIYGSCVLIYMWFHIIAGWVLTTLWIVGLTGMIKS